MSGALEGLRVLDLTWVLAGPFAGAVLADLGADVIKVERPYYGDRARGTTPMMDSYSTYFMSVNRGKRGLALDLSTEQGTELLLRLVDESDVLLENYRPGTLERLGLGYDDVLKPRNPRLIYAAISGFGQTGPYRNRPALDIVAQAMSGMMSVTGEPGGRPTRLGVSMGDLAAALYCVIGILAAVRERERTGMGQMVDTSMLDCQLALLEGPIMRYLATGEIPEPIGSRHPVFTPFQAFPTADGYIVVAIIGGTNDQWDLFCYAIGRMDLAEDERFVDGWTRTQNHQVLEPIINETLRQKTTAEWLDAFMELGIPCAPVNNIAQAVEDPQVRAREMLTETPHEGLGRPVTLVNSPLRLSRTPGHVHGQEPELGQHTDEVLGSLLGLSDIEIRSLHDEGVV